MFRTVGILNWGINPANKYKICDLRGTITPYCFSQHGPQHGRIRFPELFKTLQRQKSEQHKLNYSALLCKRNLKDPLLTILMASNQIVKISSLRKVQPRHSIFLCLPIQDSSEEELPLKNIPPEGK
ncbi:hypothetical protein CEXT_58471 [Caerostris extrusa]|uniref:Uncharacterized protein n=1 Tax=Caerostris extrusa TaxID=172846 RepID=A0AAV4RH04_CAEEX|nr:hypothetical protein CEXT_58471 [Caerostris extrusa]